MEEQTHSSPALGVTKLSLLQNFANQTLVRIMDSFSFRSLVRIMDSLYFTCPRRSVAPPLSRGPSSKLQLKARTEVHSPRSMAWTWAPLCTWRPWDKPQQLQFVASGLCGGPFLLGMSLKANKKESNPPIRLEGSHSKWTVGDMQTRKSEDPDVLK